MDPNATLTALREAVRALEARIPYLDPFGQADGIQDVMDHFEALDGWLSAGRYLPKEWDTGRLAE